MIRSTKHKMNFFGSLFLLIIISVLWYAILHGNLIQGKEQEHSSDDKVYTVVIDPGHGGKDVGATGVNGLYEKDFTLSLSRKIKDILGKEKKIKVYMTRDEDTFLSSEDKYRPKYANELKADLFISIHGNTYEDPEVSGTEAYYYHAGSKSFAEILHEKVVTATGFHDRGVKKNDFFVVKYTDMPSVLLEIGYLTNPEEEQRMIDDKSQDSTAQAICDGVNEYLGLD
ncbi:MAG: cell wall hydrolase/autolysin [Firmicutes bacterium]|nr:cell wall hydrolase/autolysin [Bacillota bacterium]